MDAETESCQQLQNETVAWELRYGFQGNAFVNSNVNLGGGNL
jgi:hypothetical protein